MQKMLLAMSSATLAQSRAKTSSDVDELPMAKLAEARTGGQDSKRKVVIASSDSEYMASLMLPEIRRKQWTKRTKLVRLNSIESMTLINSMAKLEDDFMLWAKTEKVSGLLQRRLLVQFRLYEEQLHEAVGKNRKEFDKAAPSANYDHMCIQFLERELNHIMKPDRFQIFQAGLPILVPESSASGNFSTDDTSGVTWAEARTLFKLGTTAPAEEAEQAMSVQPAHELIAVEELPPVVQDFYVEYAEATDSLEQQAPVAGQRDTREEH
ncbi:hypothetical protein F511_13206 [Dorcoceras hygrometricum]|uniref:Uncharacterized protein n=1 Tax=Dorcoceras hygrometricum TaxID=472368 RepID=A0A2Z7AJ23_9LAMI|nr:hypothetical protein F511_13206 [Dorcoceras hygrometricum]